MSLNRYYHKSLYYLGLLKQSKANNENKQTNKQTINERLKTTITKNQINNIFFYICNNCLTFFPDNYIFYFSKNISISKQKVAIDDC